MSVFVSSSMYFLSFVPLWITVLFIDIKSLVEGGGDKWTEIISIAVICLGLLISVIIFFITIFIAKDERYTFTIQEVAENKTITAEFLLSYILPLFAFDFEYWDEVVKFLIFFFVFGYLCVNHNIFSVNIFFEIMHYRIYTCRLINADDIEVKKNVISKNFLSTRKGKEIQVVVLNNEYILELCNKKVRHTN